MKKIFLKLAVMSLLGFAAVSPAKAILFTDLNSINEKLTANSGTSTYAGTFNIVDDGFTPGYHSVWSAAITFWLVDDFDREGESFTINLDGSYNTSQYTGFLLLGSTQVGIDLLTSLNTDGILNYSVTATTGDFWLKSSWLFAEATIPQGGGERVPDNGSTLILAAFALGALIIAQRRIVKHC